MGVMDSVIKGCEITRTDDGGIEIRPRDKRDELSITDCILHLVSVRRTSDARGIQLNPLSRSVRIELTSDGDAVVVDSQRRDNQ